MMTTFSFTQTDSGETLGLCKSPEDINVRTVSKTCTHIIKGHHSYKEHRRNNYIKHRGNEVYFRTAILTAPEQASFSSGKI